MRTFYIIPATVIKKGDDYGSPILRSFDNLEQAKSCAGTTNSYLDLVYSCIILRIELPESVWPVLTEPMIVGVKLEEVADSGVVQ